MMMMAMSTRINNEAFFQRLISLMGLLYVFAGSNASVAFPIPSAAPIS